jgi:hypothetical protein
LVEGRFNFTYVESMSDTFQKRPFLGGTE